MKKTLRFFGMVMMAVLFSGCFTACSDDDKDELDSNLVGIWDYVSNDSYSEYVELTKNGKITVVESYAGTQQYVEEGTWWTSGNRFYVKFYDEDDEEYYTEWSYYSLEGDTLYMWGEDENKSEAEVYRRRK